MENSDVKLLDIDMMDGNFCPMLTVGPPVIKQLSTGATIPVDGGLPDASPR